MPRNRTARATARTAQDAAAREGGSTPEQPEQDAVQPEQPDAEPTVNTEGDETATPDVPDTDSTGSTEDAEPEGDAPEAAPEQPDADATQGADEGAVFSVPDADTPGPDTEPPATTEGNEPDADADADAEPERMSGYTPAPDPDAEPTLRLEPEPELTVPVALERAADAERSTDVRRSYLVTAGAMLIAQLARDTGEPGFTRLRETRVTFRGGNGRSKHDSYAHAQLVNVLGGDQFGRALTHDNTNGRPGYGIITAYEEYIDFIALFIGAAEAVISEDGRAARAASTDRRKRTGDTNTYLDNEWERGALVQSASLLAQDIAREVATLGLTDEELANYRTHAAFIKSMARSPRATAPREERPVIVWNDRTARIWTVDAVKYRTSAPYGAIPPHPAFRPLGQEVTAVTPAPALAGATA